MPTAIIKSSQREVPIEIDGDEFWVIHPRAHPNEAVWLNWGDRAVSGPFSLDDQRFEVQHD